MPLLMCPNDNSSMTTVDRAGVQFDMCPSCRGVWLDRGELEKLMHSAMSEGAAAAGAAPVAPTAPAPSPVNYRPHVYPSAPPPHGGYGERGERGEYGERGERGEWGERGERGHSGYRRKSIFDIFD